MEHSDGRQVLTVRSKAAEGLGDSTEEKEENSEEEPDAADIELELPPELQDLLSRLGAGGLSPGAGPVQSLPSLGSYSYGDFFRPEGRECRTRREVRLKVLEALANCTTLRGFECYRVRRWNLTVTEWKALVVPMQLQTNVHLKEIWIDGFQTVEEEELIGPHLAKLISQSQKLSELRLNARERFTAKFATEIASAVRARARAQYQPLERLWFHLGGAEEGVVLSIAEIISCAHELEFLLFEQVEGLSGQAKEALSSALRGLARVKHLSLLTRTNEMMDVLVEAYTGTSSSDPVLESLQLTDEIVIPRTEPALALLIRGNISTITIDSYTAPDSHGGLDLDAWQNIGKCLLQPPTLVEFQLDLDISAISDLHVLGNALEELWNASQGSPLLNIQLTFSDSSNYGRNVDNGDFLRRKLVFLQKAMDYPCVKTIHLHSLDVGTMDFRTFVDKLASNSSVESLRICGCGNGASGRDDGWPYLFSHLRNNTSITVLDLYSSDDQTFKDLIDLLHVNYTLRSILVGVTEWAEDGKRALIREALRHIDYSD